VNPVPAGLEQRWLALWRRIGARGDGRSELELLAARYAESGRHYHTLEHIGDCLAELDLERMHAERPDEAELALWFHDAVYDSHAGDNEARSAQLADEVLGTAGVPDDARARIRTSILATTHAERPDARDAALVCDADLAILGAPPERYARYAAAIRDEYGWVPAAVFRDGRAAALARFLDRASIYSTAGFQARYEKTARKNVSAELLELRR
jgi:predicted metal-dependent HD superfamily phosphohydrolase